MIVKTRARMRRRTKPRARREERGPGRGQGPVLDDGRSRRTSKTKRTIWIARRRLVREG